jgi:signal transduction histidine kinase
MQCPQCHHENRSGAKFCEECGTPLTRSSFGAGVFQASYADLTAALSDALDRETATSDILRVISRSQTDVQAVFDAIVDSALHLLRGNASTLSRLEGDQIALAAMTSTAGPGDASQRARFPMSIHSEDDHAQAVRNRAPFNSTDAHSDPRLPETQHASAHLRDYRSLVVVPLVRHGEAVGALGVARREPGGFTDDEIALLQTFAAQAVIAIENVRLFTELKARNHDVTEALEQQTATSEILRVISHSPTDVQPVLDAVAESAARLCGAVDAIIQRVDGGLIYRVAHFGAITAVSDVRPVTWATPTGRAIMERRTIHVDDILDEFARGNYLEARVLQQGSGFRTILVVPLMREDAVIGIITIRRLEMRPFTGKQITLLQTFADQAVIAIENVRLFKELETRTGELTRSVGELTALGEVSQAISSTLDLETVLTTIVSRAVQLSGVDGGVVFEYDNGIEEFVHRAATETGGPLAEARRATRVRKGEGVVGRTAITLEPVQVPDITGPGAYVGANRENLIESGVRAILAVPMVREGQLIGCFVVSRNRAGNFPAETVELLRTFATQSALAIQNARLFHEVADKSRQLEAASQHKSEFLANMSHELRTPLNAIIGFSEVLAQGMFGETNEKQTEYLHDILESGRHLLSLINDILDLSKIEAGRMELELSAFDLPQAIQNALTLVRERALRRGIALHHAIDERVAEIRADERKVKQVLLNLLSNAIKFTPEGGRIEVRAASAAGLAEVSVTDTGVGIAPEDLEAVFEEFRQVGTAHMKAEGTGLGLALSQRFIELHGGRVWVTSQVGVGSTFTFTLPSARGSSEVRDAGTDR